MGPSGEQTWHVVTAPRCCRTPVGGLVPVGKPQQMLRGPQRGPHCPHQSRLDNAVHFHDFHPLRSRPTTPGPRLFGRKQEPPRDRVRRGRQRARVPVVHRASPHTRLRLRETLRGPNTPSDGDPNSSRGIWPPRRTTHVSTTLQKREQRRPHVHTCHFDVQLLLTFTPAL